MIFFIIKFKLSMYIHTNKKHQNDYDNSYIMIIMVIILKWLIKSMRANFFHYHIVFIENIISSIDISMNFRATSNVWQYTFSFVPCSVSVWMLPLLSAAVTVLAIYSTSTINYWRWYGTDSQSAFMTFLSLVIFELE